MCKHSETYKRILTLKMLLMPHFTSGVQPSHGALLFPKLCALLQRLALKPSLQPFGSNPPTLRVMGIYVGVCVPMGHCFESFSNIKEMVQFYMTCLALSITDQHIKQESHFPGLILQPPVPGTEQTSKEM